MSLWARGWDICATIPHSSTKKDRESSRALSWRCNINSEEKYKVFCGGEKSCIYSICLSDSFHSKHVELEVFFYYFYLVSLFLEAYLNATLRCIMPWLSMRLWRLVQVKTHSVLLRGILPKPRGCPPIRTILHSSPEELVNRRSAGKLQRS